MRVGVGVGVELMGSVGVDVAWIVGVSEGETLNGVGVTSGAGPGGSKPQHVNRMMVIILRLNGNRMSDKEPPEKLFREV